MSILALISLSISSFSHLLVFLPCMCEEISGSLDSFNRLEFDCAVAETMEDVPPSVGSQISEGSPSPRILTFLPSVWLPPLHPG